MHYWQPDEVDDVIQVVESVVIAGFVGEYFVVVEAETAIVGWTQKDVAVVVGAAISVATVGGVVALRNLAVTFGRQAVVVVMVSVAGYVAATAVEIVAIVSVVVVVASVRGQLADLSVAETVSHVIRMSMGMYSYQLIGYLAGVGFLLRVIVVAEADHMPSVVVQTDL